MTNPQNTLDLPPEDSPQGPVKCLGQTFETKKACRDHFLKLLAEKLKDPEFRKISGFPKGSDEAILRMSDPPYYTACPNPFLSDFVKHHGRPYDPDETYEREPFAVDVSVGKTDQLYKAHGYHTKVPHLAIVPSILHYTEPGDIVLDGFSGSGMTGVAAQWCGTAPASYRKELETRWTAEGHTPPKWGLRRAVLNDLGPAAAFITAGYNLPFDVSAFEREAKRIMAELEDELGWMYETLHTDGKTKGRINYTVWSEVFSCPECTGEVNFLEEALDKETKKTRKEFPCPHCGVEVTKRKLNCFFLTEFDPVIGESHQVPKRVPVIINYNVGKQSYEKAPSDNDLKILQRVKEIDLPVEVPTAKLAYMHMTHERARMDVAGVTHLHHFFLPRATHALSVLWRKAHAVSDADTRRMLVWFVEQAIWGMSLLNRYSPSHFSQVNRALSGVYYIASQHSEVSPWYVLHDPNRRTTKLGRLTKVFSPRPSTPSGAANQTGDCAFLPIADHSIDYVFTDPPFGENIYYADLNYFVESWHGVFTTATNEAIIDKAKKKGIHEYQQLMLGSFREYHRVLKPGRWITVVFSNSKNAIWRAIQEAMGVAGFVVADVRTLDKKQGSYRQVTSSAVKQDLVISAYKPTDALSQRFELRQASSEGAWAFIKEHLHNVPIFLGKANEAQVIAERTPQMLLDRMIAFHVQRGLSVPLSASEFQQGLNQRFPERDGMHFLSTQVTAYDRKHMTVGKVRQLEIFISDEKTAIQWIRKHLQDKPQSFQDLQPQFMKEWQWSKHEKTIELKLVLEQNFLLYDGRGPVPSQIHRYLSSNYKDLRNLEKEDPRLVAKAQDRWYVPDPNKETDLIKLREKALLREFEAYKASKQSRLKVFRTEAVRVGFKACWQAKPRDVETIMNVAKKIPEKVLQEDRILLRFFLNAKRLLNDD